MSKQLAAISLVAMAGFALPLSTLAAEPAGQAEIQAMEPVATKAPVAHTSAVASVPANPKIMFERSNIVGTDNTINAYNVPVTTSGGSVIYYDLAISLTALASGTPSRSATVAYVKSPVVKQGGIVAGTYNDAPAYEGECTVQNLALRTGRTESIIECTGDNGRHIEITLANGDIDATHPFYSTLKSAGIDKRADAINYIWGAISLTNDDRLGGCGSYYYEAHPVGAQQIGNQIKLFLFDSDGNFVCAGGIYKIN